MHFEQAVGHLAAYLGQDDLPADAEGAVAVAYGNLTVNLRPAPEGAGLCLDARLGSLQTAGAHTLEMLMSENRWPSASQAGVLAADLDGTACLVHHLSGEALSGPLLLSILERFARRGSRWQTLLASRRADGGAARAGFSGLEALA